MFLLEASKTILLEVDYGAHTMGTMGVQGR